MGEAWIKEWALEKFKELGCYGSPPFKPDRCITTCRSKPITKRIVEYGEMKLVIGLCANHRREW